MSKTLDQYMDLVNKIFDPYATLEQTCETQQQLDLLYLSYTQEQREEIDHFLKNDW